MAKEAIYSRTPVLTNHRLNNGVEKEWYKPLMDYERINRVSTGKGAKVAILDDGIDRKHKYLVGKIKVAYEFTSEHFETGFHSTHVAGIVASRKHGIFPDVELGCFKVLTAKDGLGASSWIAEGIRGARIEGYEVINASLGGDQNDKKIEKQVREFCADKKRFFVCASGNDGAETDYPAALSKYIPGVISVGAVELDHGSIKIAAFSSSGDVTIVAPGVGIFSTMPNDKEGVLSGTSMAAPFISSMIAVCKTIYPAFDHNTFNYVAGISTHKIGNPKAEGYGFIQMAEFLENVSKVAEGLIKVPAVNVIAKRRSIWDFIKKK